MFHYRSDRTRIHPHYPPTSSRKNRVRAFYLRIPLSTPRGRVFPPGTRRNRCQGSGGIPHHRYCCSPTPREGCTPGQVALCVFWGRWGTLHRCTNLRKVHNVNRWMEGWECKRRGDEEFLDKQAPSLCRKIRSLFRPRKKEGRLPGFQTLTHFHLRLKIADTRGEKKQDENPLIRRFCSFFFLRNSWKVCRGFWSTLRAFWRLRECSLEEIGIIFNSVGNL